MALVLSGLILRPELKRVLRYQQVVGRGSGRADLDGHRGLRPTGTAADDLNLAALVDRGTGSAQDLQRRGVPAALALSLLLEKLAHCSLGRLFALE